MLQNNLTKLKKNGFLILDQIENSSLPKILSNAGETILKTDVSIKKNANSLVFSSSPIPFHNDSPEAKWIAWYCIDPGESAKEVTELFDGENIINSLSIKEQNLLRTTSFLVNGLKGQLKKEYALRNDKQIYFCPWLIDPLINSDQKKLIKKIEYKLEKSTQDLVRISWREKRLVIIDNHRFLHQRPHLEKNSPRHLLRFWLAETV